MLYEPSRSKPYDTDIRWRVVYQLRALECSVQQVSDNLGISVSTVRRIGQLFDSTGSVDKQACPDKGLALKALTTYDEFIIMELVLQRPGIYLREICQELQQSTGTDVSEPMVCRFLQKAGFTRTKIQHVASQQSEECRAHFSAEMQQYRPDMFVFVDETGTDRRETH
jgi:transposase